MENRRTAFGSKPLAPVFIGLMLTLLSACGGGSGGGTPVAPPVGTQPPPTVTAPQLTLYAGQDGSAKIVDGPVGTARFNGPYDVKIATDGSFYIADTGSNLIRRVTAGVVTTFAGIAGEGGYADGAKAAAKFNMPQALAIDAAQNVFVADTANHVIRKIDANGTVTTFAGTAGVQGTADGQGTAAQFRNPVGLSIDGAGNLVVVDQLYSFDHSKVLRKITPAGNVTTVATKDATLEVGSEAVAIDASGNLYVIGAVGSDTSPLPPDYRPPGAPPAPVTTVRTPKLLRISPAGDVTTLAAVPAEIDGLFGGIAVDGSGAIYFSNTAFHTLYAYLPSTGQISLLAGSHGSTNYDSHGVPLYPPSLGSADGTGTAAQLNHPRGLTTDDDGNLYLADELNGKIRKVSPAGVVTTFAGATPPQIPNDGPALQALFGSLLSGSAVDGAGNVYIADANVNTVRKIDTDGQASTLAGSAWKNGSVDGTGTAARFSTLAGLTADAAGNVYVADAGNALVRKIAADGTVTTIAGKAGIHGIVDGAGSAAGFQFVQGITRDSAGNLYVTDNSTVRKITPAGLVSTIAGAAQEAGAVDGNGAAARFVSPSAIAADAGGNLYVADGSAVRKISPAGQVTTIAGKVDESGPMDGVGPAARFGLLTGIVVDATGNVYVSDSGNNAVRKITFDGTVSTIIKLPAASGVQVYPGPQSLALGSADTLYVTRSGAVLKLSLGGR